MPYIAITAEAAAAIEAQRRLPPPKYDPHPSRRCRGGLEIWVDEETLEALKAAALGQESISDTIVRRAALYATAGRLA